MTSHGFDQEANLVKGEDFCRRAAAMGADVALFPEMWNVGYRLPDPKKPEELDSWLVQAIGRDSGFMTHFQALARELNLALALTYLEKWPDKPRCSVSIIDRHGRIKMTYAKVHTCDFDREIVLTPGDDFFVCDLDAEAGPVRVGAMICMDREHPESARILMLKGAEVILTPNACELEANRLGQFRARAYENMVGLAMANYAAPRENGHSIAFDGVAFDENENSQDTLIIEAGEQEGIYLAGFDLDRLRAYRERETWGNAFRKPRVYGPLVSTEVKPPFIRPSARR